MTASESPFPVLTVAVLGDASAWQSALAAPAWQVTVGAASEAALAEVAARGADVLLWAAADAQALQGLRSSPMLTTLAADMPVLVLVPDIGDAQVLQLMRVGVDDVVVLPGDLEPAHQTAALARAVHIAVARKRLAVLQRKGGSIDVNTGLPTRAQWLDHLNQLCALREREPAPMAVLVLHAEGTAQIEATLGAEALALVQRKLAVRLRAALRASDVVGAVGQDSYAVLLAWMEAPTDADLVACKLQRSLQEPVRVGTEWAAVAVRTGIAHHGADGRDGKDGASLLRTALARAGALAEGDARGLGRGTPVGPVDRGRTAAANDAGG